MMTSTTRNKWIASISGIISIFVFWIILSEVKQDSFIYPKIDQIFISLGTLITDTEILLSASMSFLRVLLVLLIAFVISLFISFFYILFKDSYSFFQPILILFRATPLAIISVYLWISLGGEKAPYLITLLMVLPIMTEGFITAINEIHQGYINELRLQNVSIFKKFFQVIIPLIFPYIIMTLLQTLGLGIKVMIMGEYLCQTSNSLGQQIYFFKQTLSFDLLIAMLIYIVSIVCVLEFSIKLISKRINKNNK